MLAEFTVAGLTFHIYGLLIGVAIIVALKVAEHHLQTSKEERDFFWDAAFWMLLGAVVGARLWHVVTDWHLYSSNILEVLYIWQGGLSIIGALVSIFVVAFFVTANAKSKLTFFEVSDAVVIGLPFGQAIGRLGNWVNQELYGLPTSLPWKLYINENNRLPGYEKVEYYHPLFAYEAVTMASVGVGLWWLAKSRIEFKVGTGFLTVLYLAVYGWVRFVLEFLRMDKAVVGTTGLGVNQIIMLLVALGATMYLLKKVYVKT